MKQVKNPQAPSKVKQFFAHIGKFFARIGKGVGQYFAKLKPLVGMQLKDKLDFGFSNGKKQAIFKMVFAVVRFLLITMVINLIFNLVVNFGLFSFLKVLNFRAFLVIMTLVLSLSFLVCLIKTTNTLYFSKDNPVLITMPVKNSMIFTSKLVVSFIYEFIRNISYILPFFIAYGMTMSLPTLFYIWAFVSVFIFTLLSIALSGLLSIPTMYVFIAFRRYRVLEFIVVAVCIGIAAWGVVYAISLIPENIDLVRDWGKIYWSLQDFLKSFAQNFAMFGVLLEFMTGMKYNSYTFNAFASSNVVTLLVIFAMIIISLVLIYLLSKPLFLKMISTPFEHRKNENIRHKKNKKSNSFMSSVIQQSKIVFRSSNLIYNMLAVAVVTPIAIYFQNKIIAAMDTKILGNYMAIAFNVLIILLMTLSSNSAVASVYSREGNSAYLNKVNPVSYAVPLTGKLVINALFNIVSIVISTIIIAMFANISLFKAILLALALIAVYIGHLFWSAEMDVMNPQNHQYQTTGNAHKNPNENKSTIYSFVMSALFTFICFFLMTEDVRVVYPKLLVIALVFCLLRVRSYFTKVKLYYKEK